MQSHDDREHISEKEQEAQLAELKKRAEEMQRKMQSTITAGIPGEAALAEWDAHGVRVTERPPDTLGILRISIGGSTKLLGGAYCVFRGERERCVALLRKALAALEGSE